MRHQTISFIKSVVRIVGYLALPFSLYAGAGLLVISEVFGVIEEIGHE